MAAPSAEGVMRAVAEWDAQLRRAFDIGAETRDRVAATGDDRLRAILDLELNQIVLDRRAIMAGTWVGRQPAPRLSVAAMIGRGWENDLDPRCRDFVAAVHVAASTLENVLGLEWDWASGFPPGW